MAGNVTFVRGDNVSDRDPVGLTIQFDENNGGDLLVVILGAYTTSGDFPAMTSDSITDDAGNTYTLVATFPDGSTNTPPTPALGIFVAQNCVVFDTNVVHSEVIDPGDITLGFMCGFEFKINAGHIDFDAVTSDTFGNGGGLFTLDYSGKDDLIIGFCSASDAFTTEMNYTVNNATQPSLTTQSYAAWQEASVALNTGLARSQVTYAGAETAFAMMLGFSLSNAVEGPGTGGITIRVNKAPKYHPPEEGRAVATVTIDCSSLPVSQPPITYPEFSMLGSIGDAQVATVLEFDLEHVSNQGSGLTEVRHLAAWCRPGFQNGSDGGLNGSNLCLLTNTTTMQTVMLNPTPNTGQDSSSQFVKSILTPFVANKGGMKFRFICLQPSALDTFGKYTIDFFNFDLHGAYRESCEFVTD